MRVQGHRSDYSGPASGGVRIDTVREPGGSRRFRAILCGAALLGAAVIGGSTPAAAFLDFLFGRPEPAPVAPPSYSYRQLPIQVRPKRQIRIQAERHRSKRELGRRNSEPAQRVRQASRERPKIGRQVNIDPIKNPDWHLHDPTIRYGDILVLKTGPVVYLGGAQPTRSREDFVSLGQSRTLSDSGLRDIRMMVSGVWMPPEEAVTPAAKPRKSRRAQRQGSSASLR